MQAAAERKRRRMATENLLDFTTYTKRDTTGYDVGWHHRILCDYATRFARGEIKRLMVFMPPQHGKSEIVSRRLPAFILGHNPDAEIIQCSATDDWAVQLNKAAKHVVRSDEYRRLFPKTCVADATEGKSSRQDFWEVSGHRGCMFSTGIGGTVVGRSMQFGIVDDPFAKREQADSPTHREKVWNWFWNDFMTRGSRDCGILITHTRWHRDDLAGRLLSQMESGECEPWEILNFPAIRGLEPNTLDPRAEGEPLWAYRRTIRQLQALRDTDRRSFESLYQQNPIPDGGTEWPSSFFDGSDVWFDDWPGDPILKVTGIDPSKGSKAKAGDYSAIVKCMVGPDMRLYIEADLDRRHVDAIAARIIEIQRAFRPQAQAIEINGFQEWVADRAERMGDDEACFVPIVRYDNTGNKEARIRQLTPYLSMRKIRFKRNSPGTTLLVNQMRDFPNGEHDDGPDALEMAVRTAVDMVMGTGDERGVMAAGSIAEGY